MKVVDNGDEAEVQEVLAPSGSPLNGLSRNKLSNLVV
jgi:hypothetical protein